MTQMYFLLWFFSLRVFCESAAFVIPNYPSAANTAAGIGSGSGIGISASSIGTELRATKKKKGGGKKKGGAKEKKKSGFEWAASFTSKPYDSAALRDLASVACASFEGRTGKPLCDELRGAPDLPKALWSAPIACVVVEEGGNDDGDGEDATHTNVIMYANVAALETAGLRQDQFDRLLATQLPGLGGEWKMPANAVTLDLPHAMGGKDDSKYEGGYTKKIIRGNPDITISDAHRWVLEKSTLQEGKFVSESMGIAYAWTTWREGEDVLCKPGGVRQIDVDADSLEKRIEAQAAAIRELKEVRGLGNNDPEVKTAVQSLLKLKAMVDEVPGKRK